MQNGKGKINELILFDGIPHVRVSCSAELIPAPGQYLLASNASDELLPVPLFYTDSAPGGFIAAPTSGSWTPGPEIYLRGPLGKGFVLPTLARKVALVSTDDSPMRVRGLIQPALKQGAAVVVLANSPVENLPDDVEVQPLTTLAEVAGWADYAAFDVTREMLPELMETLKDLNQTRTWKEAEVAVRTPVPCGGLAECGVCSVATKSGWKMACKDGPVFDLREY